MNGEAELQAILLAAGRGSRFGEDKLAHPMADGIAIAAHAARNLLAAGLPVIAVVRPHDRRLAALLEAAGCAVTPCADADSGMGHSLAHGVRQTAGARGWIVALGDMPSVRPETISRVAAALEQGASIAAPVFHGDRGHPVGFSARHRGELSGLAGDAGARAVLQAHRDAMTLIDVDDPGVLYDIDRKTDLQRPV
jgi:molybdenum cofactor cytidylyltransferase